MKKFIFNHFRWSQLRYQNAGMASVGSVLFYAASFLILVSIPVTVIMLRTEQDTVTRASSSPLNYNNPPTTSLDISPAEAKLGQLLSLRSVVTNANWTAIYFSSSFPATGTPINNLNITIVAQGAHVADANFASDKPGYLMVVAFQLQGNYGEFRSGDIMCSWDGGLYIYKKATANPVIEMLNRNARYEGAWEKITTCQNSGVKQLVFTQ